MRLPQVICRSETLRDSLPRKFRILYRGEPMTAILIRHDGVAYGYLNRCAHMPRTLDCERADILDHSRKFLRCSMHGITYDPATGECLSEICAGKSLTALRIDERDGEIRLRDKRALLID